MIKSKTNTYIQYHNTVHKYKIKNAINTIKIKNKAISQNIVI